MIIGHDDGFLDQRPAEVADGVSNETRSIVGRHDRHTRGQRRLDLAQLRLDAVDDPQGVLSEAHHDDAADHLTATIELGHTPPHVRSHTNLCHVLHPDRCPAGIRAEPDLPDVIGRGQIATAAHHVFPTRELQQAPRDIVVARSDRAHHVGDRQVVRGEPVGVEVHLILLDEPPDRGHLSHAGHTGQPVPQMPVLEAPELGQVVLAGLVHQGVLEDPADAGRVGPDRRVDAVRQASADALQVLHHAASSPVHVGAIFEDDVDVGDAEVGEAPNGADPWRREERRHDGIGHLILDQVWTTPFPRRCHDHLHIGDIRHRVERRLAHCPQAPQGEGDRCGADEKPVRGAPVDDSSNHGDTPLLTAPPP